MDINDQKKDNNSGLSRVIVFAIILISVIWAFGWLVVWEMGDLSLANFYNKILKQPVADIFGSVNALFAGFAFGGVIITVYLQL